MKQEAASERRVLSDAVSDRIQAMILEGNLAPGDRLPPERELAEQLRVNRSSVREALKKLEQLRLVEIQQGSGIRVRSIDDASLELVMRLLFSGGRPNVTWIRDLLELREILFLGIVRLALERGTESELQELVRVVDLSTDPEVSDERFLELGLEMQDLTARMTHNQMVVVLWNSLRRFLTQERFGGLRSAALVARPEFAPYLRRLGVAAKARDADTVVRTVREVLRRAERFLLEALDRESRTEGGSETRG